MSRLKQNTTKKRQVNNNPLSEPKNQFEARENNQYKVKAIINGAIYGKEANNLMPSFYYMILWKSYLEENNIWEPSAGVKHSGN